MKLYNKILALAALPAALLAGGCDNVEEGPGRFVEQDRIKSDRKVLVMEFTGQQCPNCPLGAQTVESIHDAYPENVISVSLHPFNHILTNPLGADPGLRSEEATVMFEYYRPEGFPCAVFNGTTMSMSTGEWNKLFRQELIKTPDADITLTTAFNESSRELKVHYTVEYIDNISDETNIQLWITESGIIAPQINNGNPPLIPNYDNKHVLRVSLTGEWGESLGKSHKNGEVVRGEASYELPQEWDATQCHVVAFVQKKADKYVLQAVESPVLEAENE
ncbi:MAG: Omp28 family outer membrane lipoprotein [Bacteroides sp.]|nr:Omp28 family outer membrane lipoprotein [Bacteroides sp.]